MESTRVITTCKTKLFKCCKYHHTHSQSNILLDVFKVRKLQKRAEQFMELFNVFELKILGYYLELSVKKGRLHFFSVCVDFRNVSGSTIYSITSVTPYKYWSIVSLAGHLQFRPPLRPLLTHSSVTWSPLIGYIRILSPPPTF